MTGMVVFDYAKRYGEAVNDLATWLANGDMVSQEHVIDGLDQFPDALLKLFSGENFGKLVLKVAD